MVLRQCFQGIALCLKSEIEVSSKDNLKERTGLE
jgi:hypothetical protein